MSLLQMHPALLQLGFLALRCHMQSFLCDSRDWFVINYWVSSFAVCCIDIYFCRRVVTLCLMIVLVSYAFGTLSAGMDVIMLCFWDCILLAWMLFGLSICVFLRRLHIMVIVNALCHILLPLSST